MRVSRLYLQNYRVYEEPVDIELPPGLVGVYGLNGSGKSTLLEAIRWALFGRARTSLDQVRTADVKDECVAEVTFEHEGHLYVVRRTISGANATVKARAEADGAHVAEGVRDTTRYVHSILGMDDTAFRASVFAEQKQLAALSQRQPEDRRKLVLQLLGIMPVDAARDRARSLAREAGQQVERLRSVLPDLEAARAEVAATREEAGASAAQAADAETLAAAATTALAVAEAAFDEGDRRRQEHELVAAEAASVRAELRRASGREATLTAELAELDETADRMEPLVAIAAGAAVAEAQLHALQAVASAAKVLAATPRPDEPAPVGDDEVVAARRAADESRTRLAEVEGALRSASDEKRRAADAVTRSSSLSGGADCPLCGQALGDAFEQVQAHRAEDLAAVDAIVAALSRERTELVAAAAAGAERLRAAEASANAAAAAWVAYERAEARHGAVERSLAEARATAAAAGLGDADDTAALARIAAEVRRCREAAQEVARLRGRLERHDRLKSDLESEKLAAATAGGRLATLTEKLAGIGFLPEALAAAAATRTRVRRESAEAQQAAAGLRLRATQASALAEAAARHLTDAEAQHAKAAAQVDEARHLARLGELLGAFRNGLVARVGPRLSAQAADLFAELTDHEYDDLKVDPDTYEIRVFDRGVDYGMDRFSGSETDLANLALRVAISEHIQFQSGGTVGLLVLDEVFGPLDDDRKERMLLALERLRGRFRQVLVVTHDAAIKEQLPNALEVVKLANRRATVRPVAV